MDESPMRQGASGAPSLRRPADLARRVAVRQRLFDGRLDLAFREILTATTMVLFSCLRDVDGRGF